VSRRDSPGVSSSPDGVSRDEYDPHHEPAW
jgi:hypothetical protein